MSEIDKLKEEIEELKDDMKLVKKAIAMISDNLDIASYSFKKTLDELI